MEISKKHVGVGTGLFALCLLTQCPEDKPAQSAENKPVASASQDPELERFRTGMGVFLKALEEDSEEAEPFTVTESCDKPGEQPRACEIEVVRDCIESTGEFACLEYKTSTKHTYCFFAGAFEEGQYPVSFMYNWSGDFLISDATDPGSYEGEGLEMRLDSQEPEDKRRHFTEVCRTAVDKMRTELPEEEVIPRKEAIRASWGARMDAYLNAVDDLEAMGWAFEDLGGQTIKVEMPNGEQVLMSPSLRMESYWEGDVQTFYPEPNFYIESLAGLNRSFGPFNYYSGEDGPTVWLEENYKEGVGITRPF